jgi:hypothetical protein
MADVIDLGERRRRARTKEMLLTLAESIRRIPVAGLADHRGYPDHAIPIRLLDVMAGRTRHVLELVKDGPERHAGSDTVGRYD